MEEWTIVVWPTWVRWIVVAIATVVVAVVLIWAERSDRKAQFRKEVDQYRR